MLERNHIIGFILIFAVLFLWSEFIYKPTALQKAHEKRLSDSLALVQNQDIKAVDTIRRDSASQLGSSLSSDTLRTAGPILPQEEIFTLRNDLMEIRFVNKGGRISGVKLPNYQKITRSGKEDLKSDLWILEDPKNKFEYKLESALGLVNTADLYFSALEKSDQKLVLRATLPGGGSFTQTYHLRPDDYSLSYSIRADGVQGLKDISLYQENYLDKLERNYEYEKFYTSVYYKESEKDPDYCSCRSDDTYDSKDKAVLWYSHSNQFFNSSLIPELAFRSGTMETVMLPDNGEDLKLLKSKVAIASSALDGKDYNMKYYIGPNEYKRLAAFDVDLEDIIPYGWSIFGTINRYLIRPLFSILNDLVGSKGIIILLMTLIVKILVFPLAYKMLQSQARMQTLKPEIDKLKLKHKDDMQQQQVETMKLYNEFGVNPLGGCFPLLLQMPIWIALYRFFPATIDFRQASFLWAADLSSYDEFLILPFSIPFFGNTLSLFAFLWVISTMVFTYYSSKTMDFSANPAMLYMQYLMPLLFWFMFNKTAAGLTCYMFFSNLLNIAQTIIGKNYLFDHEKIREKLELNKAKPKKKGGFQDKLQEMIKERQRIEMEKAKNKKK